MSKICKKNKSGKSFSSKKSGKRTAVHAALFAIVSVFVILVLLIVELHPVKSVPNWGGPEESLMLATITAKIFSAGRQRKNEICRLTFTSSEVNTMLAMILRMYSNEKKPADPAIYAVWSNGCSDTECSIKFSGIYFNLYLKITPSYSNGKLHLQVTDCRLGKMPLPDSIVEKVLNDEVNKRIAADRRLRQGLSLLHNLHAEKNGEVQIELLRKNSGKLIRSFL